MPEYLVEMYVAHNGVAVAADSARRGRRAAEDLTREGVSVRFVRSIFTPEDETCFLLFEAESIDLVRTAAELAELRFDRVTETVTEPAMLPQE